MLQGIGKIFRDSDQMTHSIKKESYQSYMEGFMKEHGHYFSEMKEYVEQAEDPSGAAEEIGECLVRAAREACGSRRGKLDARTRSALHMFMVYYVFPAILRQRDAGSVIAEGVLKAWRTGMKNPDMQYVDYDTICQGFREKILGIF